MSQACGVKTTEKEKWIVVFILTNVCLFISLSGKTLHTSLFVSTLGCDNVAAVMCHKFQTKVYVTVSSGGSNALLRILWGDKGESCCWPIHLLILYFHEFVWCQACWFWTRCPAVWLSRSPFWSKGEVSMTTTEGLNCLNMLNHPSMCVAYDSVCVWLY